MRSAPLRCDNFLISTLAARICSVSYGNDVYGIKVTINRWLAGTLSNKLVKLHTI